MTNGTHQVPDIEGFSIVFLGTFNPRIFHPSWFLQQGLLGENEVKSAYESEDDVLTTPRLSQFAADWLRCRVAPDKLQLLTMQSDALENVRDVAQNILTILEHTPVVAFGFNRNVHYKMPDEESWHHLGDALVPKSNWDALIYGRVGMQSVSVLSGPRERLPGRTRTTVEPSVRIHPGVYIGVNDHYDVLPREDREVSSAVWSSTKISNIWADSMDLMNNIVDGIRGIVP